MTIIDEDVISVLVILVPNTLKPVVSQITRTDERLK